MAPGHPHDLNTGSQQRPTYGFSQKASGACHQHPLDSGREFPGQRQQLGMKFIMPGFL